MSSLLKWENLYFAIKDEKEHVFLFHKIISIFSCCVQQSFINWRTNNDEPLKSHNRIEQRYLVIYLLFCTHILSQSWDINDYVWVGGTFTLPPLRTEE